MNFIKSVISKIVVFGALSAFTFYMYMHVFEKISFIDLPWVTSVHQTTIPNYVLGAQDSTKFSDDQKYGFFGKPVVLRLPKANLVYRIQEPILKNDAWTISKDTVNFVTFAGSKGGYLGNTIIFTSQDSKILSALETLTENDRVVIDTQSGYRYHYRVIKRINLQKQEHILSSSDKSSYIYLIRGSNNKALVLEANMLAIEEI